MSPVARLLPLLAAAAVLAGATYEVGPGQAYATIGAVPWESLAAGDTVRIHYKATPYYEKFAINRLGTQLAPITVTGVPDGSGALPMISGLNATTRPQLSYYGRQRSVIKIGQADAPAAWIVLENLDIARAQAGGTYTAPSGATETYATAASSIYVETADHVTIRNCAIHDSSNGFFSAYGPSTDLLVTGCHIYGNGRVGSVYEHNVYTESRGIVFEYNRFGPLGAGCSGVNLKDRSAGTVVRYNWIEGGSRQIDLVESADYDAIRDDAAYRTTLVYGNLLIEPAGDGNRQMIHYGGDNGDESQYRKGTLHLYHNTLVSKRTDRTTLLRLSSDGEHCDARNNIIHLTAAAGSTLEMLDDTGTLALTGNWLKSGWVNSFYGAGAVTASGNLGGAAPGFVDEAGQDYHLAAGSAGIGAAGALAAAVLPTHDVTRQYVVHRQSEARATTGDLGAFAYAGAGNAAPAVATATASPSPAAGTTTAVAASASDDGGEAALTYTWSASGPGAVTFSPNGTNAAKNAVATFQAVGGHTLTVTARDAGGLTATRAVAVTVAATATTVQVSPATATVAPLATAAFAAVVRDQFGAALAAPPAVAWSVGGGGTIGAGSGLFTAGAVGGGPWTVTATAGGRSGTAQVTVASNAAPAVATATASPSPAAGTTTAVAASASDDGGEAALTYTWSASGPGAVTFSPNGTNAAKNAVATFQAVGGHTLMVTARDAGGLTATRAVAVTVAATATTVQVSPATAMVAPSATAAFAAVVRDQFGAALAAPPAVAWSVGGGGTIGAGSGLFTAGAVGGGPWTVTATAGGRSGTAQVTVAAAPPPVAPPTAGGGGGSSSSGGCGTGAMTALLLAGMLLTLRQRRR